MQFVSEAFTGCGRGRNMKEKELLTFQTVDKRNLFTVFFIFWNKKNFVERKFSKR